jgi:hypothetical protein
MPAFRIVFLRSEASGPESITARFRDLDEALDVFAARALRILYIAEQDSGGPHRAAPPARTATQGVATKSAAGKQPPGRAQMFPLRRFSAEVAA